jgi:hypothetical protein
MLPVDDPPNAVPDIYRHRFLDPILPARELILQEQSYFAKVREECGVPRLFGLDPYEMIGEKIMACNRRQGGSSKDVYDLDLWAGTFTWKSCARWRDASDHGQRRLRPFS